MKRPSLLERYAGLVSRRPWLVLGCALVIVALSLWSASRIRLQTKIADMLPPDDPAALSYTRLTEEFATTSSLMVMIEGPGRDRLAAAAEDLAARFRSSPSLAPYIRSVSLKVDEDFILDWGFMLQEPGEIRDNARILARTELLPLFRAMNERFEDMLGGDEAQSEVDEASEEDEAVALMSRIERFAERLRAVAAGEIEAGSAGPALARDFLVGDGYLLDPEARTLVFSVTPTFDLGDRGALTALTDGARVLARETEAALPGISVAFTGDVASEADEEKALGFDTVVPSLIAYALVFVLFFLSFSRPRSVLFALAALAVGIVADLGFAGLAIGELNMITSAFGTILVGLGIDFGVHVCSRFDEALGRGCPRAEAAREAILRTIVPVSMGALTTSAAFFMLLVSRTAAFRQFALVSGLGIILTLASMYSVLPALLALFGGSGRVRPPLLRYAFPGALAAWASRRPLPVLGAACGLVLASLLGLRLARFDHDMREVGPQDTESQAVEAALLARLGLSSYAFLAPASSLEEARELGSRLKALPALRSVESLADYLPSPESQAARLEAMRPIAEAPPRFSEASLAEALAAARWDGRAREELAAEVERLEDNLVELGDLAAASLGEDCLVLRKRSAMIREIFGADTGKPGAETLARLAAALRDGAAAPRLAAVERSFAPELDELARRMASADRPMAESDLPPELLSEYRGGSTYLVVARPGRALRTDAELLGLEAELAKLSPSITGSLLLGARLSRLAREEALRCSLLVAAAIFAIVLAGFRSLKPTLLSIANLAFGMVLTLGIYPLLGGYNIVNVLALPLIIGIGIDYSIHVVHAWGSGLGPRQAAERIGRAVVLSATTTMAGFGALGLTGKFRGVATLGNLLFVGTAACLAAALVVLPAILSLAGRRSTRRRAAESDAA